MKGLDYRCYAVYCCFYVGVAQHAREGRRKEWTVILRCPRYVRLFFKAELLVRLRCFAPEVVL